ncbi:MAG: EF-hand domain-containing protein [Lentisphaerales bacterium]|nr:EF-hand domain-containing protein [Lentisphaerales bacterium]
MRVSAIIAMVIGLSLISTATANPKAEKMIGKIIQGFEKVDTNGDGALSMEELSAVGGENFKKFEKELKKLDKNDDGKLSKDELKAIGK